MAKGDRSDTYFWTRGVVPRDWSRIRLRQSLWNLADLPREVDYGKPNPTTQYVAEAYANIYAKDNDNFNSVIDEQFLLTVEGVRRVGFESQDPGTHLMGQLFAQLLGTKRAEELVAETRSNITKAMWILLASGEVPESWEVLRNKPMDSHRVAYTIRYGTGPDLIEGLDSLLLGLPGHGRGVVNGIFRASGWSALEEGENMFAGVLGQISPRRVAGIEKRHFARWMASRPELARSMFGHIGRLG